ncbi:class I SAM-dependent methyltransferase [Corynebacterium heidelbergense]|uniref:SAM-dependent methyltransferase n=1 Tax=Corynebacterium heidelbergense TaxID=2055947 RepID=A0A364VEK2_9CORY|nr:class I SAM-dependent methyltransferase [Corynebacterium heidelbergense]RAV35034.1 SAM-dependent methyltransferase [Corynebacterium heidelbergense]
MPDHAHNQRVRSWSLAGSGPVGVRTRGTTAHNRLRKADRWLVAQPQVQALLRAAVVHEQRRPRAVDVGYGASHTTTVEWARWLRTITPDVEVVGLEIDPDRVLPEREGVRFALGGFELAGMRADIIRAFNVLRQYDVSEVPAAWEMMCSRLRPGGIVIEGTCDEIGRRATWVCLDASGPQTLTLAWAPADVAQPSDIAERLPKALIHCNTPGHRIHAVLRQMDDAWDRAAHLAVFGPRVRWRGALDIFHDATNISAGTTLGPAAEHHPGQHRRLTPRRRLSDNSLTLPWSAVAD